MRRPRELKVGSRRGVLAFAVLAALVAFVVLVVTPALATNALRFEATPKEELLFATRARIFMTLIDEPNASVEWHAEYAPAEANGEAPPPPKSPGEAPWVPAGGRTEPAPVTNTLLEVAFGWEAKQEQGETVGIVHHLKPLTSYYARFVADSKTEEAVGTVTFVTTAVSKPEILLPGPANYRTSGTDLLAAAPISRSTAAFESQLETNGGEITEYHFEYATSEAGPWTPFSTGSAGTVTVAEDFSVREAAVTGLKPETSYFVRLRATNEKGTAEEIRSFTTPTAKPQVGRPEVRNVTAISAHLPSTVSPQGSKTIWRFQSAPSASGPWTDIPGAAGMISQARAEALSERPESVDAAFSGLKPSTTYYVRLFAENECSQVCGGDAGPVEHFETSGPPTATAFTIHVLHGEGLRLLGSVNPNSPPTSEEQTIAIGGAPTGGTFTLTFQGHTTEPIAFDARGETEGREHSVAGALKALPGSPEVSVTGLPGGPYTIWFYGTKVTGNQPQIECDPSRLEPSTATCTTATTQQGGEAYDTHYHFEYVSEGQFREEGGWAKAAATPEVDLGLGKPNGSKSQTEYVGADLPSTVIPGETYRYRVSAKNTSRGEQVVHGTEQSLTVPVPAPVEQPACSNEALRTGASASLPDCRAYEQITPVDKEGAQEIYNYGGNISGANAVEGTLPGQDGEHVMFASKFVHWGAGPDAGQSPYFFSREEGKGWQMTAGTPEPEAGVSTYEAQAFNPDLTRFAFASGFSTSAGNESSEVVFRAGPPGGPYVTVASVPRKQADQSGSGWVAASADFSKLILAVEDRRLVEPHSTTKTGYDLYEYSGGVLRQANVETSGKTIGVCGAHMVDGHEGETPRHYASANAVSTDGSRVFFYAVPVGSECLSQGAEQNADEHEEVPPQRDLYMRAGGGETVDIGNYRFVEADPLGSTLLIAAANGQLFRYDTKTHATEPVPAGETLTHTRYSYSVAVIPAWEFGTKVDLPEQIVRYDSVQHVIECLSCASAFDPEPRLRSIFGGQRTSPKPVASANGDYVFFDTPAALLPSDIDEEFAPGTGHGGSSLEGDYSFSSDVYEWRRDGLDGCAQLQGCLALITSGGGGYLNVLLGTDPSGHDVYFSTDESLLPRDNDTAGDIYDARIGGGFPEPLRPVECQGDACSPPFTLPSALTPASATFQGAGNLLVATPPGVKPKAKAKRKCKAKRGKKCKAKPRRKGSKARHAGRSGRAGR